MTEGIGSRQKEQQQQKPGDRQSERTECNDSKEDPKSWKKNGGTDQREDTRNVLKRHKKCSMKGPDDIKNKQSKHSN